MLRRFRVHRDSTITSIPEVSGQELMALNGHSIAVKEKGHAYWADRISGYNNYAPTAITLYTIKKVTHDTASDTLLIECESVMEIPVRMNNDTYKANERGFDYHKRKVNSI